MPKRPVKKPAPRKARAKVKRHRVVPRKVAVKPGAVVLELPREYLPVALAPELVVLEIPLAALQHEPTMWERFVAWWREA